MKGCHCKFLGRFLAIDLIPEGNRLLTSEKRDAKCEPATSCTRANLNLIDMELFVVEAAQKGVF